MNYILHLTDDCNLNCKYCYEKDKYKHNKLSFENIKFVIDNEVNQKSKFVGISFYGGEPLLKKETIYKTIEYIKKLKCKTKFAFGMTTNGVLLDDNFIKFMKDNNFLSIGYSIDGKKETQNSNRLTINNQGTFDSVEKNAIKLLKVFKNTVAMVVVTKNNIKQLTENVDYLISLGFKTINLQFDFFANWEDKDLITIEENYNKLADLYIKKILNEENIDIIMFDEKIKTYIKEEYNCNDDCQLGLKSINIGVDGNFYPCVQFVGEENYIIGNCKEGLDIKKRNNLIQQSHKELDICKDCKIKKRCKHLCCCKNFKTTNDINTVSPLTCETERLLINIADRIATKLYNENSKLFIQKFYNDNYNSIEQLVSKGN